MTRQPWRVALLMRDREGRGIIAHELRCDGFGVEEYGDAIDLLRHLDATERGAAAALDLALVGSCLPSGEPLETLANIRRNGWELPVIILGEGVPVEQRQDALALGASVVFDRIPSLDELRRTVFGLMPPAEPI